MGRARKFPPSRRFGAVADTPQEADALFDRLEQMAAETENQPGRKDRVDRYAIAATVAKAVPLGPKDNGRRRESRKPLPQERLAAKPIRTTEGVELAGFNPAAVDPKLAKRDMRAAVTLQHALASRGDPVSLSTAVKIMERTRAWLADTKGT
jgi:hypothetical protein